MSLFSPILSMPCVLHILYISRLPGSQADSWVPAFPRKLSGIWPGLAAFLCQSAPLRAQSPEAGLLKAHGVDAAETDGERFGADLGGGRGWGQGCFLFVGQEA